MSQQFPRRLIDVACHVLTQRPAYHLAAEQVDHHCQEQPAFIGVDVGDVAHPDTVGRGHVELPIQQVGCHRQAVLAVRSDLEALLALGTYAVQLHEPLDALLASPDAPGQQFLPRPGPTVAATGLGVDGSDVDQQRVVAEVATLGRAGRPHEVLVVPGHAGLQHPALHRDRPDAAVSVDEGVLQLCAFAKYAVAFPRMSRSILTRASSARSRLISICSALTTLLLAPLSLP